MSTINDLSGEHASGPAASHTTDSSVQKDIALMQGWLDNKLDRRTVAQFVPGPGIAKLTLTFVPSKLMASPIRSRMLVITLFDFNFRAFFIQVSAFFVPIDSSKFTSTDFPPRAAHAILTFNVSDGMIVTEEGHANYYEL